MKKVINWMGSKSRLVSTILPVFPPHICYVEAFAGSAALFFAKEPSKSEVINDVNDDIVNLYRVIKFHLEEFVHQFNYALVSRQMFRWLKMTQPETLTDIQRATRFYYLQQSCFGGNVENQTFGTATVTPPKLRLQDIKDNLDQSWQRLSVATIEHLHWLDCCQRYDREHTLFYLDPPYWATSGYGVEFGLGEYKDMATFMSECEGKVIVSVNDIDAMHEAFSAHQIKQVHTIYSIGNTNQKADELLISNFKLENNKQESLFNG
ncbi:DNA adenine methylase [Gammaproteobacteria bacterium AH-315-C21]|nr:DNA adenine methylase [Gammaproteobacteria bacterium AH-315-C21]